MDSPGLKTLAALSITSALSASPQTAIDDLDGMTAVTLEASFQWGSGGTSCSAVVQTSFDGGTIWRDIARFDFTTATAVKHCNLEGLLSKAVTAYAALASEGVYDGVLGDQLRAVVTSVGTYANTVLSVRASVR
jgi:hypothetical protein